jgi:hypothetical protein
MKWASCRSEADKRAALRRALDESPSLTAAARALGINRQYLYELLPRYAPDTTDAADSPDSPDTTDSVGPVSTVGPTDIVGTSGRNATVGTTGAESLTYGRRRPTLHNVESVATVDTIRTAIDLPKSLLDWLEQESLRRKQAGQQSRSAKSPVVVEALELLRKRLEGGEA